MFRLYRSLDVFFINNPDFKMYRFKKNTVAFLLCLHDLQFKCIFHKQSGSKSESETKVKAGSESEKKFRIHNTA